MNKKVDLDYSDAAVCQFVVMSGAQAGAQFALRDGESLSAGGGIENDIVMHDPNAEPWAIGLENCAAIVRLKVVEGQVTKNEDVLPTDKLVVADKDDVFKVGDLAFRIQYKLDGYEHGQNKQDQYGQTQHRQTSNSAALISDALSSKASDAAADEIADTNASSQRGPQGQAEQSSSSALTFPEEIPADHSPPNQSLSEHGRDDVALTDEKTSSRPSLKSMNILFGASACAIALGTVTALYAVTGGDASTTRENRDTAGNSVFADKLKETNVDSLSYRLLDDGQTYLVSGFVETRDQRNQLLEIADFTNAKVEFDIQVNDELIESVEDIYRVNGISAEAEVAGRGEIKVKTYTGNIEKLVLVEESVRKDIPSLVAMQVINDPPDKVLVEKQSKYRENPEKRVTLVVTGNNPYIMTEDKSRYFLGAILPSGHIVESIEDGSVVVSMEGKRETLQY